MPDLCVVFLYTLYSTLSIDCCTDKIVELLTDKICFSINCEKRIMLIVL
jgi:hypothetical protein